MSQDTLNYYDWREALLTILLLFHMKLSLILIFQGHRGYALQMNKVTVKV